MAAVRSAEKIVVIINIVIVIVIILIVIIAIVASWRTVMAVRT